MRHAWFSSLPKLPGKINVTQRRPQLSKQSAKRRAESVVSEEYIYFFEVFIFLFVLKNSQARFSKA
jgi:hypothetical protein